MKKGKTSSGQSSGFQGQTSGFHASGANRNNVPKSHLKGTHRELYNQLMAESRLDSSMHSKKKDKKAEFVKQSSKTLRKLAQTTQNSTARLVEGPQHSSKASAASGSYKGKQYNQHRARQTAQSNTTNFGKDGDYQEQIQEL